MQEKLVSERHKLLTGDFRYLCNVTGCSMCFDRNINGNRDVKFLNGIIGHCTEGRNLL